MPLVALSEGSVAQKAEPVLFTAELKPPEAVIDQERLGVLRREAERETRMKLERLSREVDSDDKQEAEEVRRVLRVARRQLRRERAHNMALLRRSTPEWQPSRGPEPGAELSGSGSSEVRHLRAQMTLMDAEAEELCASIRGSERERDSIAEEISKVKREVEEWESAVAALVQLEDENAARFRLALDKTVHLKHQLRRLDPSCGLNQGTAESIRTELVLPSPLATSEEVPALHALSKTGSAASLSTTGLSTGLSPPNSFRIVLSSSRSDSHILQPGAGTATAAPQPYRMSTPIKMAQMPSPSQPVQVSAFQRAEPISMASTPLRGVAVAAQCPWAGQVQVAVASSGRRTPPTAAYASSVHCVSPISCIQSPDASALMAANAPVVSEVYGVSPRPRGQKLTASIQSMPFPWRHQLHMGW